MRKYLVLLEHVLNQGTRKTDRTGTGTISVFGYQMRFDLSKGFPLLTTKKVHLKSIIYELLWFLKGDTNIKYLQDNGVSIWDEWADEHGSIGPGYGYQWRHWPKFELVPAHAEGTEWVPDEWRRIEVDQIREVIDRINRIPDDRRLIVSAWNVADISKMKLPPCHAFFQFYVAPLSLEERISLVDVESDAQWALNQPDLHKALDELGVPNGRLSCQLYQRSADVFLGVPFNIASYALLTMMVAQVCNLVPGEFIWTGGDTHIYLNHLEQVHLQLSREPRPLPTMRLNPAVKDIFDFKYEDFTLEGYDPHPGIKASVAV